MERCSSYDCMLLLRTRSFDEMQFARGVLRAIATCFCLLQFYISVCCKMESGVIVHDIITYFH